MRHSGRNFLTDRPNLFTFRHFFLYLITVGSFYFDKFCFEIFPSHSEPLRMLPRWIPHDGREIWWKTLAIVNGKFIHAFDSSCSLRRVWMMLGLLLKFRTSFPKYISVNNFYVCVLYNYWFWCFYFPLKRLDRLSAGRVVTVQQFDLYYSDRILLLGREGRERTKTVAVDLLPIRRKLATRAH